MLLCKSESDLSKSDNTHREIHNTILYMYIYIDMIAHVVALTSVIPKSAKSLFV